MVRHLSLVYLLGLALAAAWSCILVVYRRELLRLWREPVMRYPVLIIESDDWGPGPTGHADALEQLVTVLDRHRDAAGHPALMTIGAILAVPDNVAIRAAGFRAYSRRALLDPAFERLRAALIAGRERGVFALQLHGLEHLWPPALMKATARDARVRDWVTDSEGFVTEGLPAAIQSRWTDASVLPSTQLDRGAVDMAVAEEVRVFRECFGTPPLVVVPPTFVWNRSVEEAWAGEGIRTVITPGRRLTMRDGNGEAAGRDKTILNGDRAETGVVYLVRDIYFEPTRGHTAEQTLLAMTRRFHLGRPALLETHRFNFVGDRPTRERAFAEIDRLLRRSLSQFPALRFVSPADLAIALARKDPDWTEQRLPARLQMWLRRAAAIDRLRKLAWITGLALPASLAHSAARLLFARATSRKQTTTIV